MIQQLFTQLEVYNKIFPDEKETVRRIQEFLRENGADAFSRFNYEGHITSSAWLLNKSFQHVLLIRHKKLKKLIQPGGHWEKGDVYLPMTALRELHEEVGIQNVAGVMDGIFHVDIHRIPKSAHEAGHFHFDICYLFISESDRFSIEEKELDWAKWYEIKKLEKIKIDDAALCSMIKKTDKYSCVEEPSSLGTFMWKNIYWGLYKY